MIIWSCPEYPRPPHSMLGHVTTITHQKNSVVNINPGRGGGGGGGGGTSTRKVKSGNLRNIFADDCSWSWIFWNIPAKKNQANRQNVPSEPYKR